MKWPFHRRRPEAHPEADAAVAQARRASVDADRLACGVDDVARQLTATRRRNHFGAAAAESMRRA